MFSFSKITIDFLTKKAYGFTYFWPFFSITGTILNGKLVKFQLSQLLQKRKLGVAYNLDQQVFSRYSILTSNPHATEHSVFNSLNNIQILTMFRLPEKLYCCDLRKVYNSLHIWHTLFSYSMNICAFLAVKL